MEKLIDISSAPINAFLNMLLEDKTTEKNIIWATDTYMDISFGFADVDSMEKDNILNYPDIIKPRIQKTREEQAARTRKKAEVFTPAWLCNMMNNVCDKEWFGRENVFNTEKHENGEHSWKVTEDKIEFPQDKSKTWQKYVDSRRLEITCGEAPYLVSRYDVSTGEKIPIKDRIGQLDRKLRIVNENTDNYDDWVKWAKRAFESTYGYEYQGDSLLIARINLLMTFIDYYKDRWQKNPDEKLLKSIVKIIVWNIWQMDGLQDTVPLGKPFEEYHQISLFGDEEENDDNDREAVPCKIYNWRSKEKILFKDLKVR